MVLGEDFSLHPRPQFHIYPFSRFDISRSIIFRGRGKSSIVPGSEDVFSDQFLPSKTQKFERALSLIIGWIKNGTGIFSETNGSKRLFSSKGLLLFLRLKWGWGTSFRCRYLVTFDQSLRHRSIFWGTWAETPSRSGFHNFIQGTGQNLPDT